MDSNLVGKGATEVAVLTEKMEESSRNDDVDWKWETSKIWGY